MTCPHCGAPMTDEQVFCENCGKERQLVPVYDAEIDATLETTISGIADDLANTQEIVPLTSENVLGNTQEMIPVRPEIDAEQTEETEFEEQLNKDSKHKNSNTFLIFMIGGVLAVVVLVFLVIGLFQARNESSYDYHVKKAEEMAHMNDYEQMLEHARSAKELAPNSSDAKMLIARAYKGLGNSQYEREMLEDLIAVDSAYAPAYDMLIPIYEETKSYDKIANVLSNCKEQSILDKYVDYIASPPQTAEEPGSYEEMIALKLIGAGSGTVYYTLDGSDPTQRGKEYTTPIILNSGNYTVKAVYVNKYHVTSTVMQADFFIHAKVMGEPVISLDSGSYTQPQYISVDIPDLNYHVYYSTDGSEPGMESTLYDGAIPLPLGESRFAFVMYDEGGIPGEIAYRQYRLDMELAFTGEQACNMLIQKLIASGSISDADGHIPDMEGRRQYVAGAIIVVNGYNYYLVDEFFVSPDGISQKTGNMFAVSTVTGESFSAKRNLVGTYELELLE